jgi:hypothetical protein
MRPLGRSRRRWKGHNNEPLDFHKVDFKEFGGKDCKISYSNKTKYFCLEF